MQHLSKALGSLSSGVTCCQMWCKGGLELQREVGSYPEHLTVLQSSGSTRAASEPPPPQVLQSLKFSPLALSKTTETLPHIPVGAIPLLILCATTKHIGNTLLQAPQTRGDTVPGNKDGKRHECPLIAGTIHVLVSAVLCHCFCYTECSVYEHMHKKRRLLHPASLGYGPGMRGWTVSDYQSYERMSMDIWAEDLTRRTPKNTHGEHLETLALEHPAVLRISLLRGQTHNQAKKEQEKCSYI